MPQRHIIRLFLAAAISLLTIPDCLAADSSKPLLLLWAGSSSIYYHNQPKQCAEWLTRYASLPARSELVGRSGTGVHVYLRPDFRPEYGLAPGQTILQKIAGQHYDYVVLQVPAEFINGPEGDEHDRSLDVYCAAIRAAGGAPVIYEMGWGQDEQAVAGRQKIFAAAVRNRVTHFAPCSTAWDRVRRERSDLDLQNPPDRTHPGTLGCYLNLCCFYAALTGKQLSESPTELVIWRHLDDEQKQAAQEQVAGREFDEYDAALPGWMKRLMVTAEHETLAADTAAYLRMVAWQEYQRIQQRLTAARDP